MLHTNTINQLPAPAPIKTALVNLVAELYRVLGNNNEG